MAGPPFHIRFSRYILSHYTMFHHDVNIIFVKAVEFQAETGGAAEASLLFGGFPV
jgi:hypothetical protein